MPRLDILPAQILAEREFTIGPQGPRAFTLRLSLPAFGPSHDFRFYCCYQFVGAYEGHSGFAVGVDPVSAIDAAFWMTGTIIDGLSETYFEGKITWLGGTPESPIGLPVIRHGNYPIY